MQKTSADIQKNYPNWYQKDNPLSYDDQKFIWENVPLPEDDEQRPRELRVNGNVLNGSVNGGWKLNTNDEQNLSKSQVIARLKSSGYRTSPKKIAFYLETLFGRWEEKPEHWLYIAQHFTPKTINSVLVQMIKACRRGDITIRNPGAFFTSVIKHKRKRKIFRRTNGGYKQQATEINK